MNQTTTFGRRQLHPPHAAPQPALPRPDPTETLDPPPAGGLDALRADLEGQHADDQAFNAWRRAQTPGRVLAWLMSLALLAPGLVCFLLDTPTLVSAAVELAGMVIGWRLRRMRRLHLSQIAGWEAGQA